MCTSKEPTADRVHAHNNQVSFEGAREKHQYSSTHISLQPHQYAVPAGLAAQNKKWVPGEEPTLTGAFQLENEYVADYFSSSLSCSTRCGSSSSIRERVLSRTFYALRRISYQAYRRISRKSASHIQIICRLPAIQLQTILYRVDLGHLQPPRTRSKLSPPCKLNKLVRLFILLAA